ncbi:facilitated trehalose transporter Tret1 isoform X1 [Leptinotarsa decemlineata]|uniref:facilitated trehalose transporter Tret1 isoform X1 n=2 Tax=Leptinotarsa decemlineata TaxID=7539 RepID=UPI003D3064D0
MASRQQKNIFDGTFPQLVAVLTGTLAAVSDGMMYGWTAPVVPILLGPDSPVKTTKAQAEWLENLLMLGSFSGLGITMYLVDKIGRKRSILFSSFVTLVLWIIKAVAPRIEYIFVARAFAGAAGNMAFVAAPMYIAEIADQKVRGFLSSMIYIQMLIGILLIYAIAPYVAIYTHCIVGGSLVFIELITFPFMPESPYYLLYKDKPLEAEKSLRKLRPSNCNIEKELEEIKTAVERQKTEKGRFQDLIMVPSNRKAILIMTLLNMAQHFSSISVLLMNLHVILEAAGSIYIESSTAAIIFAVIMVVAAATSSFAIDKYGRKFLLISSSILTGLCLMVIAIYFNLKNFGYSVESISWIPIVSVMLYACFFKLGLGMVPIVLTAELFPARMKAIGMTVADGTYVISALLSLQVYQQLSDNYGLQYPFYVFSLSCFGTASFTYFFIPETKGKTLEEIQFILKGIHVERKSGENDTML